jgi:putative transposase
LVISLLKNENSYKVIKFMTDAGKGTVMELCGIAGISRAGYYKWLNRKKSTNELMNESLTSLIREAYEEKDGILGYRQITIKLYREHELKVNHKRIYRLMKILGLKSVCRKKKYNYKKSTPEITAENILNRDFNANNICEKWLTDVTEFKYGDSHKAYLSAILDLGDKSVVSFVIGHSNNNALVFETFDLANAINANAKPIFHSDRGFQYTSKLFKKKLDDAGMTQSMSRVGRCIDNGPMEGFWGILKSEMYYLYKYETYEELKTAIEEYIDYYNTKRYQKRLKCMTPMEYRAYLTDMSA